MVEYTPSVYSGLINFFTIKLFIQKNSRTRFRVYLTISIYSYLVTLEWSFTSHLCFLVKIQATSCRGECRRSVLPETVTHLENKICTNLYTYTKLYKFVHLEFVQILKINHYSENLARLSSQFYKFLLHCRF